MQQTLERIAGYVKRCVPWSLRALRNSAVARCAALYAVLPRSLWDTSAVRRQALGVRTARKDAKVAVLMPGLGWLSVPSKVDVPHALDFWALDVAVLDAYDVTRFLSAGMVVFDVWACVGSFSLLAARLVGPGGRVYAVEPVRANYECLCRTVELNGLGNVELREVAAGDTCGTLRIWLANPGTHTAVTKREGPCVEVPVTTLDQLCSDIGIHRLDFVKIDVEGFEPQVLAGARESIRRFRPVIAAAAYHFPGHRELLPAMIREIVPDYEIRVGQAAPGLELKCWGIPPERVAESGGRRARGSSKTR